MSDMEPDVKNYLAKIANSLAIGILWLITNSTIGIGFDLAFFEERPRLGNYIFYCWFLISLFLLILYYYKKWKV